MDSTEKKNDSRWEQVDREITAWSYVNIVKQQEQRDKKTKWRKIMGRAER